MAEREIEDWELRLGTVTRLGRWICVLTVFDPDYCQPCPRCGKPCQWACSVTIWPTTGPIRQATVHSPLCPCPDDDIRDAISSALAAVLVSELAGESGASTGEHGGAS